MYSFYNFFDDYILSTQEHYDAVFLPYYREKLPNSAIEKGLQGYATNLAGPFL
jgi:hypothetical protein